MAHSAIQTTIDALANLPIATEQNSWWRNETRSQFIAGLVMQFFQRVSAVAMKLKKDDKHTAVIDSFGMDADERNRPYQHFCYEVVRKNDETIYVQAVLCILLDENKMEADGSFDDYLERFLPPQEGESENVREEIMEEVVKLKEKAAHEPDLITYFYLRQDENQRLVRVMYADKGVYVWEFPPLIEAHSYKDCLRAFNEILTPILYADVNPDKKGVAYYYPYDVSFQKKIEEVVKKNWYFEDAAESKATLEPILEEK